MLTDRFPRALALAMEAHAPQLRKGTSIPYISHPLGVASLALEFGADENQAIAALLHDVIEDGGCHFGQIIIDHFGERGFQIVEGCTDGVPDEKGEKEDWKSRKSRYLEHLEHASDEVLLVSGSDKLHNARAIVSDLNTHGQSVFDRFNASKEETLWYYSRLAEIFTKRSSPLARSLELAVGQMREFSEST